jgi:hypothetical protein
MEHKFYCASSNATNPLPNPHLVYHKNGINGMIKKSTVFVLSN